MYDMELQRELAMFLLRLFWAEGWNDDMLGEWIRETFHASSWENERSSWRGQQENGRFQFSAGFAWTVWFVTDCTSTATVRVCLLNVSKPIVELVEHK